MPGFDWDDNDPLEGLDTGEPDPAPPSPGPFQRPTAPAIPKPAIFDLGTPAITGRGLPLKVNPESLAKAMADFDEESAEVDADQLSEAEWRLEKAQYYRAVINSQLLSSGHPAAVEVETELQGWAKNQMEVLLGIKAKQDTPVDVSGIERRLGNLEGTLISQPNLQFTDDEAAALKAVAARVLSKPGASAPTPPPTASKQVEQAPRPIPAKVNPVNAKPQAAITPVQTPGKPSRPAGRGRPRKNPCAICGQMECGHKSNQTKIPQGVPVVKAPPSDTFQGMEIKIVDGKRIVDMPNGVRYRLDRRPVQYKDGTIKEEDIPTELAKPKVSPMAIPYPSEQEAMALAAVEGAQSEGRIQRSAIFAKIVDAAQKAPDRESYIPQPPPRK
jgi:hypothetical protein